RSRTRSRAEYNGADPGLGMRRRWITRAKRGADRHGTLARWRWAARRCRPSSVTPRRGDAHRWVHARSSSGRSGPTFRGALVTPRSLMSFTRFFNPSVAGHEPPRHLVSSRRRFQAALSLPETLRNHRTDCLSSRVVQRYLAQLVM